MELTGKGVSGGIAAGKLVFLEKREAEVEKKAIQDVAAELARFEAARVEAIAQLGRLAKDTAERLGAENAVLFDIHQMMLDDLDYRDAVAGVIEGELLCAEYAVKQAAGQFAAMLAETGDDYMRERAADVYDISGRLVDILSGRAEAGQMKFDGPVVLAAEDFAPSETAQMDREKVVGMATRAGAANSHTAIFARTMGIPAVIGLGGALHPGQTGNHAVLDGGAGKLYIDPDADTEKNLMAARARQEAARQKLEAWRGRPTATQSGQKVELFANIGTPEDAALALAGDAEGVGLFRSEFLFLERDAAPDEETQYRAYREVAEKMDGRRVVIRTLDIGADKQVPYLGLPKEENPALGLRAIRLCLADSGLFKTQLRAIYRASAHGNLCIMLPMITSVNEVRRAKEIARAARDELAGEGLPFHPDVPLGIMVETPASAVIRAVLATEVDFFSIGTHALPLYTLAVDRQNDAAAAYCDPHHEAVLRLIELTAKNARAAGIWVGICGELAAETALTARFVEMGIDELSVAPSAVLRLRALIAEMA